MDSGDSSESNISTAIELIYKAKHTGANWILLPEMFTFMGSYHKLKSETLSENSKPFKKFQQIAKDLQIVLFLGTIPEPSTHESKVYNTLYVIGRQGEIISKYRKTHLFNLNTGEKNERYCEADGYLQGDELVTTNIDGFNVHLSICYDIRFSSLFNSLQKLNECDVIVCPSAFTKATGKRHWHMLMQSRAIEYQCYVIASAQTGTKKNKKTNYGHALICDPWGKVLVDTGESSGIVTSTISKQTINTHRQSLPVLSNQRPEIYT